MRTQTVGSRPGLLLLIFDMGAPRSYITDSINIRVRPISNGALSPALINGTFDATLQI